MNQTITTDDGLALRVRTAGEGDHPPLLMVHGFPFDHRQWDPQFEALALFGRLAAPDLRGLGSSQGPLDPRAYHMDRYADDLAQIMDHLRWERAVVAGLSMGGYIALAFAHRHRARLAGLVLLDTQAAADDETALERRRQAQEKVRRQGPDALVGDFLEKVLGETTRRERPEVVAAVETMMLGQSPHGVIGALEAMASRPDRTGQLPDIDVPALVIVGSEDTLTPPEKARVMAENMPDARLAEIPRAGHVTSLEAPEAVNRELLSFLAEIG